LEQLPRVMKTMGNKESVDNFIYSNLIDSSRR